MHHLCVFLIIASFVISSMQCGPGHMRKGEKCAPCDPGTYFYDPFATEQNPGECYSCMSGFYASGSGSTACDSCTAGMFANTSGLSTCTQCPKGSFQYAQEASACVTCPSGTHQSAPGSTTCLDCAPGSSQASEGMVDCQLCTPGSFAHSKKSAACVSCPPGTHQPFDGGTGCFACQPGTSQVYPGSATCSACKQGSFQPQTGQSQCDLCQPGRYQEQDGASDCSVCAAGTFHALYGQQSENSCADCKLGQYAVQNGSSTCEQCEPGTFRDMTTKPNKCLSCPPGRFQTGKGATQCTLCLQGTFSTAEGFAQECLLCASGTYSTTHGAVFSSSCVQCEAGLYSTGEGQGDADACGPCPAGSFPSEHRNQCSPCPKDALCLPGMQKPVSCEANLICNGTHLDAIQGFVAALLHDEALAFACPRGTLCALKDPEQGKGLLPPNPQQVHFVLTASGNSRRVEWPFNQSQEEAVLFWLQPEGCREGFYLDKDSCSPCPNGTYSGVAGALDSEACQPCGKGTFAATEGLTACVNCPLGTFGADVGASTCTACPPGNFQDREGQCACKACRPGTFSSAFRAKECAKCVAGMAQSKWGAQGCDICNSSQYSSDGDISCLPCGQAPKTVDPQRNDSGCMHLLEEPPLQSVWIKVAGLEPAQTDECLALADSSLRQVKVHRLHAQSRCLHQLRVAGNAFVKDKWLEPDKQHVATTLQVVPYNATFYHSTCLKEGFGAYVVMRDESGMQVEPTKGSSLWMSVQDPVSKNLLFQAACLNHSSCHTNRFCPSMTVLICIRLQDGKNVLVEGSALVLAGKMSTCPPVSSWILSLRLHEAEQAFFPQSTQQVAIAVLNAPSHVQAFQMTIRVQSPFQFLRFTGFYPATVSQELSLVQIETDTSSEKGSVQHLGQLHVSLGAFSQYGGLQNALQVVSAKFMLLRGNWLSTGVEAQGFVCRHDGFLSVLVDHVRPTSLVAFPTRTTLIHWRALQTDAALWPAALRIEAVWNTLGMVRTVQATCSSLTPHILFVKTCALVEPIAMQDGEGLVMVDFQGVKTFQYFDVTTPTLANVHFFPFYISPVRGRLLVVANVLGLHVDATAMLGSGVDELECPANSVIDVLGQSILCTPPPVSPPYLLSGTWTATGSFLPHPPVLSPLTEPVLVLDNRFFVASSTDLSRAAFHEDHLLYLRRAGGTPRCVNLISSHGDTASVPVVPPAPARLVVHFMHTILVGQQDFRDFIPKQTSVSYASVLFSDNTSASVLNDPRLVMEPDPYFLRAVSPDTVQTRSKNGSTFVIFRFTGIPCLVARVELEVYETSVASSSLVCKDCPALLSRQNDPLALEWPKLFPSAVPASSFVVRHRLVDNTTTDEWAPLHVHGQGIVYDEETMLSSQLDLVVSTEQAHNSVVIPVVAQWAVQAELRCDNQPCNGLKNLTTLQDRAVQAPFSYRPRLNLSWAITLFNETQSVFSWLPQVAVLLNESPLNDITTLAFNTQGPVHLRVVFGPDWNLSHTEEFTMQVHALEALSLSAPSTIHRIHCTREFESAPVFLAAVLSDGLKLAVDDAVWAWEGVVELWHGSVFARQHGQGVIRAEFGGLVVRHVLDVVLSSRLYTSYSLPSNFPSDVWQASIGETLELNGKLEPVLLVRNSTWVHQRVVRWVASEPTVIDFPTESSMRLLSDFYGPITITAVVRGCEGAEPVTLARDIRINVIPDKQGQVDFGDESGPPLQAVAPGNDMWIRLYLFSPFPLLSYTCRASLPGLRLNANCGHGELPFSLCTVSQDRREVKLNGRFPQSQRRGRVLIGTMRGTVELHAIARLQVSVESAEFGLKASFQATYGFAVQLGFPRSGHLQRVSNTVNGQALKKLDTPGWYDAPSAFSTVTEPLLVAAPDAADMTPLFPSSFSVSLFAASNHQALLSCSDPRLQAIYDNDLLAFDPIRGIWSAQHGAQGVTSITLRYVQPKTLASRDYHVRIVFAQPQQVLLLPERMVLSRLHCSDTFETKGLTATLTVLGDKRRVPLDMAQGTFRVEPTHIAAVDAKAGVVRGTWPGSGQIIFSMLGLSSSLQIEILNTSVLFTDLLLPSPYLLSGSWKFLQLKGKLANSSTVFDNLTFLQPIVTVSRCSAFMVQKEDYKLQGLRNTHPKRPCLLTVSIRACARQEPLSISSPLTVRLTPELSSTRPSDISISFTDSGFHVVLQSLSPVSSIILTLQTDALQLGNWRKGGGLPKASEVSLDYPIGGHLVLAAVFLQPVLQAALFSVEPVPTSISGFIDASLGGVSILSPIVAGAMGRNATLALNGKSVVNANDLVKAHNRTALFRLVTGKTRLVDPVLYSNDRELSAMFRVTDHYLQPDNNLSSLNVTFHSPQLAMLLALRGSSVDDLGVQVPAALVGDGWYAVQFRSQQNLPRVVTRVSFRLMTKLNSRQVQDVDELLTVGRELHVCPRYAADRGVFKLLYRMRTLPAPDLQQALACVAHVVPRRVQIWGPVGEQGVYMFSIMLESFIRVQQAHEEIMNHSSFAWSGSRRLLQGEPLLERVGISYVNDTADEPVQCPAGMFFTRNGTYSRLPLHSVAGPDCYGLRCVEGYVLVGTTECAPAAVPTDVILICSLVILAGMVLLCCVFCALYVSRLRSQAVQGVNLSGDTLQDPSSRGLTEPFEENDPNFKNILGGVYLDDYSSTMLDDDFSCVPLHDTEDTVKR